MGLGLLNALGLQPRATATPMPAVGSRAVPPPLATVRAGGSGAKPAAVDKDKAPFDVARSAVQKLLAG